MALPVKQLPWELEEEILSRLPPQSLVRFKTVSKRWNTLSNDKSFLKSHLSRSHPQFIFITHSKLYSIDIIDPNTIDPTIELRELPIPYGEGIHQDKYKKIIRFASCGDGLLFGHYRFDKTWTVLWNPWLRHVTWFKNDDDGFFVFGLGYDNEKGYKILGYIVSIVESYVRVAIYECASHAFKFIDEPDKYWFVTHGKSSVTSVSLNGNLYWVTCNLETRSDYFIRSFDFTREIFFNPFCLLPCQKDHPSDILLLAVYKGDRFSLLKQCRLTRKIGIWVTKERISNNNVDDGEGVVWINLMTLSTTSLPRLFGKLYGISYYISDKTLFMCCADDETRVACIYIVRADLCKKIQIDSGTVECCHCVYTPNLISVP